MTIPIPSEMTKWPGSVQALLCEKLDDAWLRGLIIQRANQGYEYRWYRHQDLEEELADALVYVFARWLATGKCQYMDVAEMLITLLQKTREIEVS